MDAAYEQKLATVNPPLLALFTSGGEEYLESREHQGRPYFGKTLGGSIDLPRLELVQGNVLSILRRLVPDYAYESVPLCVIAYPTSLSSSLSSG